MKLSNLFKRNKKQITKSKFIGAMIVLSAAVVMTSENLNDYANESVEDIMNANKFGSDLVKANKTNNDYHTVSTKRNNNKQSIQDFVKLKEKQQSKLKERNKPKPRLQP
jgi:hypothetical protein